MAAEYDWEMHRHDSKNFTVTVKDSADVVVSLLGASEITFAASKKTDTGFSGTAALTKKLSVGDAEVEITDAVNGVCVVKLVPADTDSMKGEYYYEVELIDSSSDVGTVLTGTLTILKDLVLNP